MGRLKIRKFSSRTVTGVLLVGALVGQLNITVDGPMKAVFFLLFLFAVGYKVGPQFFRGLKKDGLPQVGFAVLMCIVSLIAPWILAKIMGYHVGEAAGLLAGSQTISAVIGVASDTINQLGISENDCPPVGGAEGNPEQALFQSEFAAGKDEVYRPHGG